MKKKIIILGCFILVFLMGILVGGFLLKSNDNQKSNENSKEESKSEKISNIEVKENDGQKYYIIKGDYDGDFDYQKVDLTGYRDLSSNVVEEYNNVNIISYDEYSSFCEKWNLTQKYQDANKNYMLVAYAANDRPIVEARIADVKEKEKKLIIYMWERESGYTVGISGYFIAIPVDKTINSYEINMALTSAEYKNVINHGTRIPTTEDKPIIYIYPEREMMVNIRLKNSELLTVSYPKYNEGWNVLASPNGVLTDQGTNKHYYGLYYEGKNHVSEIKEEGFVVEGKDTVSFLENKLSFLGLNEREINEFIIYWLPKLEGNNYNYIRFETKEEIESYMPLEITPTPDSVIRVIMDYKPLEERIEVKEQELIPQERLGYSVIEWGGSEIK